MGVAACTEACTSPMLPINKGGACHLCPPWCSSRAGRWAYWAIAPFVLSTMVHWALAFALVSALGWSAIGDHQGAWGIGICVGECIRLERYW
eukprot:1144061-Pelagomonas_calceolata.AAC.2